jgi:hypothetical protein
MPEPLRRSISNAEGGPVVGSSSLTTDALRGQRLSASGIEPPRASLTQLPLGEPSVAT